MTIVGLKSPVTLAKDEFDRYGAPDAPADLFDAGDAIDASASGGELGPFSLSSQGVAPLEIVSRTVELRRGESAPFSWTSADPGSRVQLLLLAGPHDPTRPTAAILCDSDDAAGQVEIPANLVDGFLDRLVVIQKFSRVTRYRRDAKMPFGKEIELFVGSARGLDLIVP
jgi:hypothetical protein